MDECLADNNDGDGSDDNGYNDESNNNYGDKKNANKINNNVKIISLLLISTGNDMIINVCLLVISFR